jgi:fructose 1,6-bisphosphatase
VKEIQGRAADSVNYDLAWFLEQGAELFKAAKEAGDHSAASAQYQRLATVAGVWVEKSEGSQVVRTVSAEPMTAEQWQQQHAAQVPPLN